jgi:hypothetical protein
MNAVITEEDIEYGEPNWVRPNRSFQLIIDKRIGIGIGTLHSYYKNAFCPVVDNYIIIIKDTPEIRASYHWNEYEDEGWLTVHFDNLPNFIKFYNELGRFYD